MPLGLHQQCLARLREVITAAIPRLDLQMGAFITPESFVHLRAADEVLPKSGPARDQLLEFVGDTPASTFIYHRLNRAVLAERAFDEKKETRARKIRSIPGLADPVAIAARVVEEFDSLPWDYSIAF